VVGRVERLLMMGRVQRLLVICILTIVMAASHKHRLVHDILTRHGPCADVGELVLGQCPWRVLGQCCRLVAAISRTRPRQHRAMIWQCAHDSRMIWPVPYRWLEDDALVVAFALSLGLDAVGACWSLFTAFDASFPTRQTASLGPFPHLGVVQRARVVPWSRCITRVIGRRTRIHRVA
jgi:hypothetical protein